MKPTWPAFKTATSTSIAFNTALTQVYSHSHPPRVVSVLTTSTPAHTTQPAETKITMPSLASNSYLSASSTARNEPAPRTPRRPHNRVSSASSTDSEAEYDALVARVRAWQRERLRTPQKAGAGTECDSEEEEEGCESDADEDEDEDEDEEEGGVSVSVRSDGDCCSEGYEADDEGGVWDLVDGDEAFVGVGSDGEEFYYRAAVGEGGSGGSGGSDVEDEEEEEEEESEDEDEDGSGPGGGESAAAGDRPRGTVGPSITLVEEEALDGDSGGERYRWRHTDRARLAAFRRQRM